MKLAVTPLLLFLFASPVACGPKPLNKKELTELGEKTSSSKRYPLKGKVVSVDQRANMANIDGEEIPGLMGAMVMPYVVKPASDLEKLSPGDTITADVVVQGDDSWIENVAVTAHRTATLPK
jgi:Cu/Ag efflux protein CusF